MGEGGCLSSVKQGGHRSRPFELAQYLHDRIENFGAYVMKRVAASAHIQTPWLFEPAKQPNDRTDYCLGIRQ